MLYVCEGIPIVALFTLQLFRDRALRAENETKKKCLGDHYMVIRIKINATEIPRRAPHVASTYTLSTNNYDHSKKCDDPKNCF